MRSIRRRLYAASWALFGALASAVLLLRSRLPERLPGLTAEAWTDRDAFFGVQLAVLALILLFAVPIDRVLLRRSGDSAFMAAIALFMALLFTLILLPVLLVGLGFPRPGLAWSVAAALAVLGSALAYLVRMRALRADRAGETRGAGYFRKIRPGWVMGLFPLAYPFFPHSLEVGEEGIRLRGALMDCRWRWEQVVSVAPGRPAQAYAGVAVRMVASGRDLVVLGLRDLRWPVVFNAPDRPEFLEAVRKLAPTVPIGG